MELDGESALGFMLNMCLKVDGVESIEQFVGTHLIKRVAEPSSSSHLINQPLLPNVINVNSR